MIAGPAIQTGEYSFRVDDNYFGKDSRRSWQTVTICLEADGDDEYKSAVQEINIKIESLLNANQ